MDSVGQVSLGKEKRGNQTLQRLIEEIKTKNLAPTHFLLIFFTFKQGLEKKKQQKARRKFYECVNNQKCFVDVPGFEDPLSLRWRSPNDTTSILYYTSSALGEEFIRQITRALVKNAYQRVLDDVGVTQTDVQVNYLAAKNVNWTINFVTGTQEFLGNASPRSPISFSIDGMDMDDGTGDE
jgi:hypothetical protein